MVDNEISPEILKSHLQSQRLFRKQLKPCAWLKIKPILFSIISFDLHQTIIYALAIRTRFLIT